MSGGRLVWSRTAACHAVDAGSKGRKLLDSPAHRTFSEPKITNIKHNDIDNLNTCIIHVSTLSTDQYCEFITNKDKPVSPRVAKNYVNIVKKFGKTYDLLTEQTAREFLKPITSVNSYNNVLSALKQVAYMYRYNLNIKHKQEIHEKLIIAPSYDTVQELLERIEDLHVKTYLALCASTGIRVERILSLKWNDIDLDNGFVLRKVEHKISKWYRPNPIHKQIVPMLNEIKSQDSVFPFSYHRVKNRIREVHDKITPTQLRDFFYNQALTCGMNTVIVEWLMGHDIGIAKHYLADNIKQEYSKFEQTVKLS